MKVSRSHIKDVLYFPFISLSPICLVFGAWCLMLVPACGLVLGAWCQVSSAWCLVLPGLDFGRLCGIWVGLDWVWFGLDWIGLVGLDGRWIGFAFGELDACRWPGGGHETPKTHQP